MERPAKDVCSVSDSIDRSQQQRWRRGWRLWGPEEASNWGHNLLSTTSPQQSTQDTTAAFNVEMRDSSCWSEMWDGRYLCFPYSADTSSKLPIHHRPRWENNLYGNGYERVRFVVQEHWRLETNRLGKDNKITEIHYLPRTSMRNWGISW